MPNRNLLDVRRSAYTTEGWKRREEIFERVAAGKMLTKADKQWMRNVK